MTPIIYLLIFFSIILKRIIFFLGEYENTLLGKIPENLDFLQDSNPRSLEHMT